MEFIAKFYALLDRDFFFYFCAILGSAVLILQLLLALFGIIDHDIPDMDSGDVKWISKQTIFSFLTMFGWAALACRKEFHLSSFVSVLISTLAGAFAVLIVSYIFKIAAKLRSSGNVFNIDDAIGKEATVYQKISSKKTGKVLVSINSFTHEIEALSDEEIPSFVLVKIIKKADDKTVFVVPIRGEK